MTVVAVDEAGLMSATYANVTVDVIKSSLTALMFTKSVYEMRIPEDAPRGQLVGKVDMQNSASRYTEELLEVIPYLINYHYTLISSLFIY